MADHSKLIKMFIYNFGCIGPEGLEIALDNIICLVGPNNTGKSTVLKAYEYAVQNRALTGDDFCQFSKSPPSVEIWVHIPKDTQNIDEKWKEAIGKCLIVRSKWQWNEQGQSPTRTTWNPEINDYDPTFKAAGLDNVFSSRLPKPLRIGALDGPEKEHDNLLRLVLEPIEQELKRLVEDEASQLNIAIKGVKREIQSPITGFVKQIEKITEGVNTSYQKTFPNCAVDLKVDVSDIEIKPMILLQKGSRVDILESEGRTSWKQQGIGSQRALFWSILEIRSRLQQAINNAKAIDSRLKSIPIEIEASEKKLQELKQEKAKTKKQQQIDELKKEYDHLKNPQVEQQFLPSYMLLIDEPEVALHPNAVRAARGHLYELAQDAGWQVMLTTHHPAFVDPLEDHTTIVRLTRENNKPTPKIYRSDEITFEGDGKENLKMLLQFDNSLAEAFFGGYPVIIEGDTEYATFQKVMELHPDEYQIYNRPILIRARGKYTIILVSKIFTHFKIPFSVLHDSDSPLNKNGSNSNAWTANSRIMSNLIEARRTGMRVVHRVSIPDFERHHGLEEVEKEKPFNFQKQITGNETLKDSVKATLDELISVEAPECLYQNSMDLLVDAVKDWAETYAPDDERFNFE